MVTRYKELYGYYGYTFIVGEGNGHHLLAPLIARPLVERVRVADEPAKRRQLRAEGRLQQVLDLDLHAEAAGVIPCAACSESAGPRPSCCFL